MYVEQLVGEQGRVHPVHQRCQPAHVFLVQGLGPADSQSHSVGKHRSTLGTGVPRPLRAVAQGEKVLGDELHPVQARGVRGNCSWKSCHNPIPAPSGFNPCLYAWLVAAPWESFSRVAAFWMPPQVPTCSSPLTGSCTRRWRLSILGSECNYEVLMCSTFMAIFLGSLWSLVIENDILLMVPLRSMSGGSY